MEVINPPNITTHFLKKHWEMALLRVRPLTGMIVFIP
jgi:hypothetical protein